MPQHPAPGPDGPPAADASGTIPTQTAQTAPAGDPVGTGIPDAAQPTPAPASFLGWTVDFAGETSSIHSAPAGSECEPCGNPAPYSLASMTEALAFCADCLVTLWEEDPTATWTPPVQWWALLGCGHRVQCDPYQDDPSPDPGPTALPCPRCRVHRPVDIYPLTALSDPDNLLWVEETDQ